MQTTKQIGDAGEDMAVAYLLDCGYEIFDRNYRTRFGEIDIVGMDGDALCFVEVKKKGTNRFGTPAEMINGKKIDKIQRTAESYIKEKELGDVAWRIDAVLIDKNAVELIQNVTG